MHNQKQSAELERQRNALEAQLHLDEARYALQLQQQNDELELQKQQQTIRNMGNDIDLLRRLIETAPEIVAALPEIDELKIWQTDGQDIAWQSISGWLQKGIAVADQLGVKLPSQKTHHAQGEIS